MQEARPKKEKKRGLTQKIEKMISKISSPTASDMAKGPCKHSILYLYVGARTVYDSR